MSKETHSSKSVPATVSRKANKPTMNLDVEFDLKLGKDDIVNLAVGEAEEKLVLERQGIENQITTMAGLHAKAVAKLGKLAESRLAEYQVDSTTLQLVQILKEKTGVMHVVKIENSTPSYSYEKKKDNEPDIDVKKMAIVGSVRIYAKKTDDRYGSALVSWDIEIPFTPEMKATVSLIGQHAEASENLKIKLNEINRLIFDLPKLRARALRQLTLAVARGEVKTSADAVDIVLRTESKALPQSTQLMLED